MKKKLSLFLFLFSYLFMGAQIYEPMAIEGAHWTIRAYADSLDHHTIVVRGDTTINNVTYKKVYKQNLLATDGIELDPPYIRTAEYLLAAMRDDEIGKKVYSIFFEDYLWRKSHCGLNEEHLLYDFLLPIGDTTPICSSWFEDDPYTIDTILSKMSFGKERQHQYVSSVLNYADYNIEGIGTEWGPFTIGGASTVVGTSIIIRDYCIGSDEECGILFTNDSEEYLDDFIKTYPNPVNDFMFFEINLHNQPFQSLVIYNSIGGLILKKELNPYEKLIKIQMAEFANGYYWAELRNGEQVILKKIIKHKN